MLVTEGGENGQRPRSIRCERTRGIFEDCKDYVLAGLETSYSLITKLALYTSRVYENKHHAFTSALTISVRVCVVFPVLISLTTIYASPRVEVYYSLQDTNTHWSFPIELELFFIHTSTII